MNKQLLLGAEAIALGALDAGISGVYAYPGTPSTEITEYIQKKSGGRERRRMGPPQRASELESSRSFAVHGEDTLTESCVRCASQ